MTNEPEIEFEHYVKATAQVVSEFRDVLAEGHAKLVEAKITLNGHA